MRNSEHKRIPRFLITAFVVAGFIAVAFLFAIGLTQFAQGLATLLLFSLACYSIFLVARDARLAISVITVRLLVIGVAVLYVLPFFHMETDADADLYHNSGVEISRSILSGADFSGTEEVWGTNFYALFTGFFYTLCGTSFTRIMVFNSLIAASGSLLFYRTFLESFGKLHWTLKFLLVFDPSLLFWSSIHGKDPLILFWLGLLLLSVARILRAGGMKPLLLYFLALLGVFAIRPQIALLCALAVFLTLFIMRLRAPLPSKALTLCFRSSGFVVVMSTIVVLVFYGKLEEFTGAGILSQLSIITNNLSYGGTAIDVPQITTWADLLRHLPIGAVTVVFRPFPWEQGNVFIRFAALDQVPISFAALLVIWALLRRFVPRRTGTQSASNIPLDPVTLFILIYCAMFILFYAIVLGNVGTLVRAKIQLVPFLLCAAFALNPLRSIVAKGWRTTTLLIEKGIPHEG